MKKALISITALLVLCTLCLTSCNLLDPTKMPEKTFTKEGISFTLTEAFFETSVSEYTVAYDSTGIAVWALREEFSLLEGFEDYTLEQYANLLLDANDMKDKPLNEEDGLMWYEYDFENTQANTTYHYYTFVYKADDAFWMVQFACTVSNVEKYEDAIMGYAKKVTFVE